MNEQNKRATGDPRPLLIVGARPTGMTAAMELSRFGVPIRIVDKLLAPSTTTRALAVQARYIGTLRAARAEPGDAPNWQ